MCYSGFVSSLKSQPFFRVEFKNPKLMNQSSSGKLSRRVAKTREAGFALVVTLSLMILLTIIAVGLLTLSSISLRASSQASDMNIARSNARMALMLAIGDLQKYAGLDTRVTAKADILDEKNPPVPVSWKSWEGTTTNSPEPHRDAPFHRETTRRRKRNAFSAWLVSGDPAN